MWWEYAPNILLCCIVERSETRLPSIDLSHSAILSHCCQGNILLLHIHEHVMEVSVGYPLISNSCM
jgi:hypothetical protein